MRCFPDCARCQESKGHFAMNTPTEIGRCVSNAALGVPLVRRGRHLLLVMLAWTALLGLGSNAHAARTIDAVTLNNAASVTVTPGDYVTVVIDVTTSGAGSANDWRSVGWRISATPPGALTCWNHANHTSAGSFSENTTIQVPATPGTYNVYFVAYDDDACTSGASGTAVLAGGVVVQAPALAIDSVTLDGAASVTVGGGQTITAVVNATSNSSTVGYQWRSTGWRISTSAPGSLTCVNHANHETAGTFSESFSVTAPSASGVYNAYFIAYNDDSCGANPSATAQLTSAVNILSLTEFNATGGTTSTNGLHFYMEDTTKIQVRRLNNTGQVYAPGSVPPSNNLDNGIFIRANGLVYGPSHTVGGGYTPSGGMYSTYAITQATPANPATSGVQQTATGAFGITAGPQVSVLWKYTTPLDFLTAEVTLTIPAGYAVSAANPVRYYHVFDTYLGGSDSGCGVSFLDGGKRVIGTYPPPSGTICPSSTAIPANVSVVESFRERSGQPFSSYCASGWATFFDTSTPNCSVRQSATMSNTVVTTYRDTGMGIELDFTAPGTYTFSYDFVIGTPNVPDYDHIEIQHDGSAGLCSDTVTVLACTSSTVPCPALSIVNTGTLTGAITTSPTTPTVTKTPASFTLGSAGSTQSVALLGSGAATYTLGASGMSSTPLNGTKCWNTATSTASCTFTVTNTPCLGGYECLETGATYTNLITTPSARNPLFTKLSGADFKFDVLALQSSGDIATSYTAASNVTVELFDDSASPQPACSAYASPVASQAITFVSGDAGRKLLATNVNLPKAYPRLRCRVKDTNVTPTLYACSSDNFAVRPQQFTASSSNANANNAGTSTTATPRIKAGTAFSVNVDTSTVGYGGTPTLNASNIAAHSGAVQTGTLAGTFGAANAATGNGASGAGFTYSEAGYFRLSANAVVDPTFTAIDSAVGDCVAGSSSNTLSAGKYGCNIGNAVSNYFGRFTPDHFDNTVTQGCVAGVFTYSAQPFTATVTARNSAGDTVKNYAGGSFAKAVTLSNAGDATNMAGNVIAANAFADGVAAANAVTYTFPNPQSVPLALTLRATDTEAITSTGFTEEAASIRSGRVQLLNAYGSERLDLPMTLRAQYWAAGGGWQTNAVDSCTATNLAFAAIAGVNDIRASTCVRDSGNPGASGMGCVAAGAVARQFREAGVAGFAGDFNLWLQAPQAAGAFNVTATVPAWLQFNWTGVVGNPTARATFGVYKSPLIYRRENY